MRNCRTASLSVCAFALGASFTAVSASASVLLDTGALTFGATGTQTDRLFRNGVASTWGESKPFPGVVGDELQRGDEVFTVHVGISNFLQINLDDPKALLFDAAYAGAFTPNGTPPFFGLDLGYLGDPGITQPFGNPNSFQILVPRHSTVAIEINEVDPGGGQGAPFRLQVEAFIDSGFNDIPEPAAIVLCATGLVGLMAVRRSARY
jgi:hypothetical protein